MKISKNIVSLDIYTISLWMFDTFGVLEVLLFFKISLSEFFISQPSSFSLMTPLFLRSDKYF